MFATSTHEEKISLWNFQIHTIKYVRKRVGHLVKQERLRIMKQNKCQFVDATASLALQHATTCNNIQQRVTTCNMPPQNKDCQTPTVNTYETGRSSSCKPSPNKKPTIGRVRSIKQSIGCFCLNKLVRIFMLKMFVFILDSLLGLSTHEFK